ncbi:ATP-binding protein [Holospora undulata]|uniref:histidine kinase n=1 Tax=Holospora undulata HU1 TaxID=1321371 RepID=A0A061JHF3_9PROT|nr:ATP-binding protein [Holospora undulata]ETZ04777.1 nitrogen regulation protein NtrY [Holospora undulata HU1]
MIYRKFLWLGFFGSVFWFGWSFKNDRLFLAIIFILLSLNGGALYSLLHRQSLPKTREENRKFQRKIVSLCSMMVVAPCFLITVFSLIFLELGVQTWFKDRVRTVINTSTQVADAYLLEHKKILEESIMKLAHTINTTFTMEGVTSSQELKKNNSHAKNVLQDLKDFLNYMSSFSTHQAILFERTQGKNKIIAKTQQIDDVIKFLSRITASYIKKVSSKRIMFYLHKEEGRVVAVVPLSLKQCFLLITRQVDPAVLHHVEHMKHSGTAYQRVFEEQSALIQKFIILFVLFSCILLLFAILVGVSFSKRLTEPIGALLAAAQSIRLGELIQVQDVEPEAMEELRLLIQTFNVMVQEMHAKKEELMVMNRTLEERSHRLSNVLKGVSSGVLGLEMNGRIILSNERAQSLLEKTQNMENDYLQCICAEFWDFVKEAHLEPGQQSQKQMTILQNCLPRIYALYVRAWSNGAELTLTFDDITELVAAQKRSVWEDVARRVAHEVKNPLTPIALSAQRLQRRFLHLVNQPEIFQDCVDTIVRQVAYIDQLISEFSSFSRMTEAKLAPFSLHQMLHRLINFHQQAYPEIQFSLIVIALGEKDMWQGDEGQLERAFSNLLKNSIEAIQDRPPCASLPSGNIEVRLIRHIKGITLSIKDNGKGLNSDAPLFLFDPYVTTKSYGTGLGLSIVQRIVSDHHGTLTLSPCDFGAIATLELPNLKNPLV